MNILVVDDYPLTVEGYIYSLSEHRNEFNLHNFSKAYNCEQAYSQLMEAKNAKKLFDIAIIDMNLPEYKEKSILSGSDLSVFIREMMPTCKIIMITAHIEYITVYEIYKKVRPDGFVIKSDITAEGMQNLIKTIIKGDTYQSPTVKNCISEIVKEELMLDDYNRQILTYLSKGFKIKELEEVVFLTTSAIKKRVGKMKKAFETDESGLVKKAIVRGFI